MRRAIVAAVLAFVACSSAADEQTTSPAGNAGSAGSAGAAGRGQPAGAAGGDAVGGGPGGAAAGGSAGDPSSGGAGSAGEMSAPIELSQRCASVAQQGCAALTRCAPSLVAQQHGDEAACVGWAKARCERAGAQPGAAPADQRDLACAAAIATLPCGEVLARNAADRLFGCADAGTLPDGAPCTASTQCSSQRCAREGDCGQCAPLARLGERCERGGCEAGLLCAPSRLCVHMSAQSEPCDAANPCAPGLGCNGKYCIAQGDPGEPCDAAFVTSSCAAGSRCNPTTAVCEPWALAAGPGDPCGLFEDRSVVTCPRGLVCIIDSEQLATGHCASVANEGDPCALPLPFSPACATVDLVCIDGRCGSADLAPSCD